MLIFATTTPRPCEGFPGACTFELTWSAPDSAKVQTYYIVGAGQPVSPVQPKNHQPVPAQYFEVPSGVQPLAGDPGQVIYVAVLVAYTNGTYSPWQHVTVTVGTC